jgi:DNA-binding transcriptional LysR family regulator
MHDLIARVGRLRVLPVVVEFLRAYPDIDIRIMLADRLVNLVEEHIDLAVRIGELPDSSLVVIRIGSIRLVICGSPAYFAERGVPKRPDDLAAHSCVTFEGLMSPDAWTFATGKSDMSIPIHSRLVVNTAQAAIAAAIAGIGITRVLSYQIAHAVQSGVLVVALGGFEPAPSPVSLVYAGGRAVPAAQAADIPRFCNAAAEGRARGECQLGRVPQLAFRRRNFPVVGR